VSNYLHNLGQLFIIGFRGAEPPDAFLDFLGEEKIGGVLLLEEACASHEAARQNIERINRAYRDSARPFIAIDQEGGRVCRLKGAPAEYRAATEYKKELGLDRFAEDYNRSALYMEKLGINLNFAPVADLYLEKESSVLADRCFGEEPEGAIPFIRKSIEISRSCGILSCLKHFPGLGAAPFDPHEKTAIAPVDEVVWRQREQLTFEAGIGHGADMIMTTHMRVNAFGGDIVTANRALISGWLRHMLAFDGPVVTDCLLMEGAAPLGHVGERAVEAFRAGHDILLFGNDHEKAIGAYDYFVSAVKEGEIEEAQIESSMERVSGLKFKLDSSVVR